MKSRSILLLIPIFIAEQWGGTYQSNYLTSKSIYSITYHAIWTMEITEIAYFTVRSRALASFLTAIVGFLSNTLTGLLLDLKLHQSKKNKIKKKQQIEAI